MFFEEKENLELIRVASPASRNAFVKRLLFLAWYDIFKSDLGGNNPAVLLRERWLMYNQTHLFNETDQRGSESRCQVNLFACPVSGVTRFKACLFSSQPHPSFDAHLPQPATSSFHGYRGVNKRATSPNLSNGQG